jgi:crotonobetainyl-CoA:carnitine CoA-transferase CaiB-like acyl-CoA transferase
MMALEGLRVFDASTILAGPPCCQILGDFGADVIKIEHPAHGDSMRGHGHQKDGVPLWWKEIAEFEQAGAAVYSAEDIIADPHVRQTGMVTEVDDPDLGPMLMHNVLWRMSRTPGQVRFTGRSLGADTDAVLTGELGYDSRQVTALREQGVVR